ncbi:hypothetical protein SAMN05216404_11320 [Nitrosospira multiformis]|uniref:Uncharacterized protein n=1 Tax=Nitrosospira multiformis TaxID=1231 RepID=A0A1H8MLJ6_9PROT|nr:hypothetical protein [Nitrosospira multiformis]SEO17986.1 hypothetical protein SAMN05216404_11320 [Nitrosospira multiformis]
MNPINPRDYFKSSVLHLSLDQLIRGPVSNLNGVSAGAEAALNGIGILSVFDLAFSEVFRSATYINAIDDVHADSARTMQIPRHMLDEGVNTSDIARVRELGIKTIKGIGEVTGRKIRDTMAIQSIRDLALWPPYLAAVRVVNAEYGLGMDSNADPETPQDLVPRTGEYPVEIVRYNSVVLIKSPRIEAKHYKPLERSGKVSFNLDDQNAGFTEPGFGALLNYSQSWYVEGITNGSLLHCVALAPGESTKVAVINWRRASSGTTIEDISQTERLSNTLTQSRAMSEIVEATAREMQEGSSEVDSDSETYSESQGGWSFAILAGMGGQHTSGDTDTNTNAYTSSSGERNISSTMQQKIDSSTQQKSFSARNRRASVVTEVLDTESESISTRTITNYNHMHALTMQYWQVIQVYRTEVRLESYRRCLFIPMEVFDFKDERLIERFKNVLIRSALNPLTRELLVASTNRVNVRFTAPPPYSAMQEGRGKAIAAAKFAVSLKNLNRLGLISDFDRESLSWSMNSDIQLYNIKWDTNESDSLKHFTIIAEDGQTTDVTDNGTGFSSFRVNPDIIQPLPLSKIDRIVVVFDNPANDFIQSSSFQFKLLGNHYKTFTLKFFVDKTKASIKLLEFDQAVVSNELSDLLNQHALYYSQQIWMNVDAHFLTMQLSQYSFNGQPITESIDPKPVAVVGNCLGFIWHNRADKEWNDWVKNNINLDRVTRQRIALPTDGVFGEAVLGRFNSAEKLDFTRFWNWQDSPPPVTSPEIAPLQAGQQDANQPQQPGRLDSPVVNIMNPTALPDPIGMPGILQAIAAANLFRDMTGITQAATLASAVTQASAEGAAQVGQQVASNLNAQVELSKTLAALVPMLFGFPPLGTPAGAKNASVSGALFNAAQNQDAKNKNNNVSPPGGVAQPVPAPGNPSGASVSGQQSTPLSRGETGQVLDMMTGAGAVRGIPLDLIQSIVTGQVPSSTASKVKIVGDPLDASPQSVDLAELLAQHIKSRSRVPRSRDVCVDACYQYLLDTLRENDVETFELRGFDHHFPHIRTHSGDKLSGPSFVKLFYSNSEHINWQGLPRSCRGKGPIGALLFADMIAGRAGGITITKDKWPQNMLPGTLLQLWTDEQAFNEVRDTGRTLGGGIGHAPIFLQYKDNDPTSDTIIVADQYNLSTEYKYPVYNLRYVIAARPAKIELVSI